jgi:hypothetical protein
MLAVDEHLAAFALGGADAVADRGEILLGRRLERDAHVIVPRLGDEADRVRLRLEQRGDAGIVRERAAGPPRHAERREGGLELAVLGKQLRVGRVRARIAALDVIEPEGVEHPRDRDLVGEGEVDAVRLRAVAQRGVEQIEPLFHDVLPSPLPACEERSDGAQHRPGEGQFQKAPSPASRLRRSAPSPARGEGFGVRGPLIARPPSSCLPWNP